MGSDRLLAAGRRACDPLGVPILVSRALQVLQDWPWSGHFAVPLTDRRTPSKTGFAIYSLLLASALALAAMGLGMVFNLWDWIGGLFIAFGVFLVVWILITRRFAKRLQPAMMRVQQQMQAGHVAAAKDSLKDMLPFGNWVPLLRGQLLTQLGMISMHTDKKEEAVKWLKQAPTRSAEAQLALASLQYRDGEKADALKRLAVAHKKKPKHVLLAHAYAWLLHKEKRMDEAIQVLHRHLQKQRASPLAKDNHLRLQNGRPMKMEPLGMEWYGLAFEKPPQSMVQQQMPSGGSMRKGGMALPAQGQMPHQGRKGFRQEAKNKSKRQPKAKGKK